MIWGINKEVEFIFPKNVVGLRFSNGNYNLWVKPKSLFNLSMFEFILKINFNSDLRFSSQLFNEDAESTHLMSSTLWNGWLKCAAMEKSFLLSLKKPSGTAGKILCCGTLQPTISNIEGLVPTFLLSIRQKLSPNFQHFFS